MVYFLSMENSRGKKRILEQKKFRLLGQLQIFRAILTSFNETNYDMDLLQGDKLFQNVYSQFAGMYKSNIDQKFLVDMIKLKN